MTEVDFYYSIGSRYSYLAASQLEALAAETGCAFRWRPLNSRRLIALRPDDPFATPVRTGPYAASYRALDLARWARHYGIGYVEPDGRVRFDSEQLALACTAADRLGAVEPMSRGLYAAMYGGTVPVLDRAECVRIASASGLDEAEFAGALDATATQQQLDRTIDEAFERGVFGVPTFGVGEELFFGNDRLGLLRDHLLAANADT